MTIEENLDLLKVVLLRLKSNKLELRLDKCYYLMTSINYLGYNITSDGISHTSEHIESVFRFPVPTHVRQLQNFLRLINYIRRFIRKISILVKPLYDLIKKNAVFVFKKEEITAFEFLKNSLVSHSILAIYSPKAETELHCGASAEGFSAVLLQKPSDNKFHRISFFSKRTTRNKSKYHSYEVECLAIIYAIKLYLLMYKVLSSNSYGLQ